MQPSYKLVIEFEMCWYYIEGIHFIYAYPSRQNSLSIPLRRNNHGILFIVAIDRNYCSLKCIFDNIQIELNYNTQIKIK